MGSALCIVIIVCAEVGCVRSEGVSGFVVSDAASSCVGNGACPSMLSERGGTNVGKGVGVSGGRVGEGWGDEGISVACDVAAGMETLSGVVLVIVGGGRDGFLHPLINKSSIRQV